MKQWPWFHRKEREPEQDRKRNELASMVERQNALIRRLTAQVEQLERGIRTVQPAFDKIWRKVRHLEPSVQAIIRQLAIRPESLAYPERLTAQRFRLESQNQEDGITLALFAEIGTTNRRFVELGSGLSGGNSAVLAHEFGWSGLMVDGNAGRMAQVARRFPGVCAVAAWITRDSINDLLCDHGAAGEVDLLSLDLDGNDYWVWEAMTACSPRLMIVEYNSMFGAERAVTVPYDAEFDRKRFRFTYYGASLAAMAALGRRKGYRLVTVEPSGVNAYFLRDDIAPHIPACEVRDAFRLMEKYDVLIQQKQEDVFAYAEKQGLPIVEVAG